MKYMGLELGLSIGLWGRDVFFLSVAGLVLGEKGNDVVPVLEG